MTPCEAKVWRCWVSGEWVDTWDSARNEPKKCTPRVAGKGSL